MPATNTKTKWVSGNLVFYDKSGNIIATWDATNRQLTIPSGSKVAIAAVGGLTINGSNVGVATIADVTATAAEINKLTGVTGGTASASLAVVLDASKKVKGIVIQETPVAAAVDGAIAILPGIIKITKAGVAVLTLADPAVGDEGTRLLITSATANAHTVANTGGSGFNAGGAGAIKATFGGAIGDSLELVAIGAKWNVVVAKNVTFGVA